MAQGLQFNWVKNDIDENLKKLIARADMAVLMLADTQAKKLQGYMQTHRPWTDRTGLAKARLSAVASTIAQHTICITLAHGVNYGIWLELAHEKNYAIVGPTINLKSSEVFASFDNLLNQIAAKAGII